jgi:putative copper resistance protein D
MVWSFALVRTAHFLALMTIFGVAALRAILRAALPEPPPEGVSARLMRIAAYTSAATALLWFLLVVAQSAGTARAIVDPEAFAIVATRTSFGPVLLARIALAMLLVPVVASSRSSTACIAAGASTLVLIAATSHAAASGGTLMLLRAANDAVHLLTAGFWVGALAELVPLVVTLRKSPNALVGALMAFSPWGAAAVVVLIATGSLNAVLILRPSTGHWSAAYLTLLGAKIVLASVMVALALTNRHLTRDIRLGNAQSAEDLTGTVLAEFAAGIAILLIVGFLGLIAPAQ